MSFFEADPSGVYSVFLLLKYVAFGSYKCLDVKSSQTQFTRVYSGVDYENTVICNREMQRRLWLVLSSNVLKD